MSKMDQIEIVLLLMYTVATCFIAWATFRIIPRSVSNITHQEFQFRKKRKKLYKSGKRFAARIEDYSNQTQPETVLEYSDNFDNLFNDVTEKFNEARIWFYEIAKDGTHMKLDSVATGNQEPSEEMLVTLYRAVKKGVKPGKPNFEHYDPVTNTAL